MNQDNFTRLLQGYGDRLGDRKMFNGLVKDFFMDEPLQANLILALYDMKIHEEISAVSSISNSFAFRFVKKLMDEHGTSRKNADWAVSVWCVCYGKQILGKPCELQLFDMDSQSNRPVIINKSTKGSAYKDLFSYKKIDYGYAVTDFTGENKSSIIFQDRYNDEQVTEIAEDAFKEVPVGQAIISEGYLKIGKSAFQYCTEITQIVLPMSLKQIDDYAFDSCEKLSSVSLPVNLGQLGKYAFASTNIKSVSFPEALYWIGEGAFANCDKLNGITIPKNVETIPDKCFENCGALSKVRICDGVRKIGLEAFWGCSSLLQITIPDSVSEIGEGAFSGTNDKFVLQCSMGSFAEGYARKNKLKYQLI